MRVFAIIAIVLAVAVVATEARQLTNDDYQGLFSNFVKKYNKEYTHDEFFNRFSVFKANYDLIRTHNKSNATYSMAVNEYADMTFTEFHSRMTGYKHVDQSYLRSMNKFTAPAGFAAPASVDWRTKNAVTPVKNQQQCGSCWAFSTTGSVEGANALKSGGKLISLSEQQLVDCSAAQGNQGCNGGLMDNAFTYIKSNGGLTTEDAYPYTAAQGTCKTGLKLVATVSSFADVAPGDEKGLEAAVALGPVSVAIEADQQAFQFYSGGVMTGTCGKQLDHGVLAVGYGTDAATKLPFWIVKNSWGPSWGEAGYIRLQKGIDQCGISQAASRPTA